jgi:DNA invertase Pin-like site-specific DNA recombinase
LDLTAKVEIFEMIDMNCKRKEIADKFGVNVTTVSKPGNKRKQNRT